jgi:hypothetical protein
MAMMLKTVPGAHTLATAAATMALARDAGALPPGAAGGGGGAGGSDDDGCDGGSVRSTTSGGKEGEGGSGGGLGGGRGGGFGGAGGDKLCGGSGGGESAKDVMMESEPIAILGLRAEAKSVRWRHMHCVGPSATTQPPPANACLTASQLQLAVLPARHSAHAEP